jgi:hypothetical protein
LQEQTSHKCPIDALSAMNLHFNNTNVHHCMDHHIPTSTSFESTGPEKKAKKKESTPTTRRVLPTRNN